MHNQSGDSSILVWDVDDVLNSLTLEVLSDLGVSFEPEKAGKFSSPWDFVRSLGVTEELYLGALDSFRRSRFQDLQPCEEILAWFQEHGKFFTSMALTSTPLEFFPTSAKWVMTNFQPWIDGIGCTPSRRESDPKETRYRTKADYLKRLGARYILIDDSLENLVNINPNSGTGLLYPTPWNGSGDITAFLRQLPTVR